MARSVRRRFPRNPGSTEAGAYGLMRETCFVPRRLEVVAVTGLLLMSWCVLGAAGFRTYFPFVFLLTHTACCKYEAGLLLLHIYLYSDRQTEPGPAVG